MNIKNQMKLVIPSRSQNEAFSRSAVSAFAAQLDPTVEEINDIKAAVSEAVTNCIVHAYPDCIGDIEILARILADTGSVKKINENIPKKNSDTQKHIHSSEILYIRIKDKGCGIPDIKQAMTPLFTTCAEGERAGLGFAVMESFTDKLCVTSKPGKGTTVIMTKRLTSRDE